MGKKLTLVPTEPSANPSPPRHLGPAGAALWQRIQSEYQVSDSGGVELLLLAAEATDRASECAAAIEQDGVAIRTKGGLKSHPLLREETQIRALISRLLGRLGLDVEPVRASAGRPPGYGS
jgi:hypothetical protein